MNSNDASKIEEALRDLEILLSDKQNKFIGKLNELKEEYLKESNIIKRKLDQIKIDLDDLR